MKHLNNFVLGYYVSDEYFCDRDDETKHIINAMKNGRNVNIISHRRLGKTGLIFRIMDKISDIKDYKMVYIDLLNTQNTREFIDEFARIVLNNLETKSARALKQFANIVKGIRPSFSINPLSGLPEIDIEVRQDYSENLNLQELFLFLDSQKTRIIIAFDEFQQILNYPEKNIEATLRKYIQQSPNLSFIYSGSQTHLLTAMFANSKRPFYQSAEFLFLDKIKHEVYAKFIQENFAKAKQNIEMPQVDLILNLSRRHTYYVQFLCNRIFSLKPKNIDVQLIHKTLDDILYENRPVYYTYQKILSKGQFNLLKAIAKEENLSQPTSKAFIQKHALPTTSSIQTALAALLKKEMVYQENEYYYVYDVFFSRYLEGLK